MVKTKVPTVTLNNGLPMPVLGLGTWGVSQTKSRSDNIFKREVVFKKYRRTLKTFKVEFRAD